MCARLVVSPLHELFGAEVKGLDLSKPLPSHVKQAVERTFATYAVLVFPGQQISDEEQIVFSEHFGPLEPIANYSGAPLRLKGQISDLSNLDGEGKIWDPTSRKRMFNLANMLWHTDSSFKPVPALCSLLSGRVVPPVGGETEFVDLRVAYDALPDTLKKTLQNLIVEHDIFHSRAQVGFTDPDPELRARFPPMRQRLVRTHFPSGRRSLYLASHCTRVIGWPEDESRALLEELMQHATKDEFVYTHKWQQYDLVMWDNRCTMHRGRPYDDLRFVRDVRRTTVSEHADTLTQEPIVED